MRLQARSASQTHQHPCPCAVPCRCVPSPLFDVLATPATATSGAKQAPSTAEQDEAVQAASTDILKACPFWMPLRVSRSGTPTVGGCLSCSRQQVDTFCHHGLADKLLWYLALLYHVPSCMLGVHTRYARVSNSLTRHCLSPTPGACAGLQPEGCLEPGHLHHIRPGCAGAASRYGGMRYSNSGMGVECHIVCWVGLWQSRLQGAHIRAGCAGAASRCALVGYKF